MVRSILTSESVTPGHPDKMADQISDTLLDEYLSIDPHAKVAIETVLGKSYWMITGEVTSVEHISSADREDLVRKVIRRIGYTDASYGASLESIPLIQDIVPQSPDIAGGVLRSLETRHHQTDHFNELGAGDQGIMFGYACRETEELMPLPITLAHSLAKALTDSRTKSSPRWLRPDGKTQVSVIYEGHRPVAVDTVLVSTQHDEDAPSDEDMASILIERVIKPCLGKWWHPDIRVLVNPSGRFVLGGPMADAGLTGRKIIVDTYGGAARHGGGAFSGKDPSKVDRSAAYASRWVAKHIVASGLAYKAEVQLAYAIGMAAPVSIRVETGETGVVSDTLIAKAVRETFDLRPQAIIEALELQNPIYADLATFGHMGRVDLNVPWERPQRVSELLQHV